MNIYVSNLGFNVESEGLKDLFTPYGDVTSAKIIFDSATGRSRGFGFVEMTDDAAGEKAIAALNQTSIEGRNVNVVVAKPREERTGNNNSYGGSRNSGGYKKSW